MTEPLRVLIADDEPLARAHLRSLLADRDDVVVSGECGDGRAAVEAIRNDPPDLVLLDIQMPELDGLAVVREVGPHNIPPVLFVTAYDEYAIDAFDVHAYDYLLKPVDRERFQRAFDRIAGLIRAGTFDGRRAALTRLVERFAESAGPTDRLAIRTDGRVLFVRIADIDWVEAADDNVRYHIGRTSVEQRDTLTSLERRLPPGTFMRVHRSAIVNIDRIREMQPWFQGDWAIILQDGTKVLTGRTYRARIRALIDRFT